MEKLFTGMLLIWLDVDITLDTCKIGLLPDFVGYIILMQGLRTLQEESPHFGKVRPWALAMAVYSGVLYAMDLFGVSLDMPFMAWCLGLAAVIAGLAVQYGIVAGVQDMETAHDWQLQGEKLRTLWLALAVMQVMCSLLYWVPWLSIMLAIAAFIVSICFLAAFYRTKKQYQEYVQQ